MTVQQIFVLFVHGFVAILILWSTNCAIYRNYCFLNVEATSANPLAARGAAYRSRQFHWLLIISIWQLFLRLRPRLSSGLNTLCSKVASEWDIHVEDDRNRWKRGAKRDSKRDAWRIRDTHSVRDIKRQTEGHVGKSRWSDGYRERNRERDRN